MSPSLGDTRTESDFLSHIKQTIAESPASSWVLIMDQLNAFIATLFNLESKLII